jgi:hypothetical protein
MFFRPGRGEGLGPTSLEEIGMRVRRTLLVTTLVILLLVGGLAVGSNMGFKYAPTFPGSEINVDHWVSLPYKSAFASADEVCNVVPNASLVSRFDPVSAFRVDWTCPFGDNFDLNPGEGVFIRVTAASNPVFVGSHDPDLEIPVGGFTVSGIDHIVSIPYHTTAVTAQDLCDEIANSTLVSRFDPVSQSRIDWSCPFGSDFAIPRGEAFAVRVGVTGPGWKPDHH